MVLVFIKYCKKSYSKEGVDNVEAVFYYGRDEFGDGRYVY